MEISGYKIGKGHPCFIIGEIGMNHDGNKAKAKELIDMAADAGVNAVKFQSFRATDIINPTLPADYDPQEPVPDKFKWFYEYIQQYELPYDWHDELIAYANARGLVFISTPCSSEAVEFLSCRTPAYKIASMDLTNLPLIEDIGGRKKPVIMSTGIGSIGEIENAIMVLEDKGTSQIALMHCVSNYPARPEELNLKNIQMLETVFGFPVGFSDHSLGTTSSIAAVALGACIIEKHITLSRNTLGPDHYFALEHRDLTDLVKGIREVESAIGISRRKHSLNESSKRNTYRRSLLCTRDMATGERICRKDISVIRPGDGIFPYDIDKVEGLILTRDIKAYTPLKWSYFK